MYALVTKILDVLVLFQFVVSSCTACEACLNQNKQIGRAVAILTGVYRNLSMVFSDMDLRTNGNAKGILEKS